MIYPKKNNIIRWGFHTYVHWIIARNFNQIDFNTININKNRPVLLIANHSGFWDGFLSYYINCKLFKKKFHIMLLEKTAKRIPILKYGGAFSINKKSKDIIKSLDFAAQLLNDPDNLVLIFPQGKLYSNFITAVEFEKGVMQILKQAEGKFQLVFSAMFIEHFQHKKPDATVYLKAVADVDFDTINELQAAYQQHYNDARLQQIEKTV
jgi:1-acyl-sn-glycerol-3-phosphate acyltransferase